MADTLTTFRPIKPKAIMRFLLKCKPSPSGCMEWSGGKDRGGYGYFRLGGGRTEFKAHRAAWIIFNQKNIPRGLFVMHSCDNPSCVRAEHLSVGTRQENVDDSMRKGRILASRMRGDSHPCNKLGSKNVLEIRDLASSMSQHKIAKIYGTSQAQIWKIVNRRTWRSI